MTHNTVSLQVSLPQMLDLALGTPEVGSVNLNILHNFLHVLLHQINLTNSKVEYRGDDATRLKTIISSLNTGPSVYLHEYSITDNEGNVTQRDHTPDTSIPAAEIYKTDSKNSISKSKQDITNEEKNSEAPVIKKTKGLKQKIGKGIEDNCQSVIFVEPIKDGLVPSALGFKKLNDTVEKLEQQFKSLEDLATNPEIIERIKTGRADPLNDMWSIININKRLDASEQGISKLMTLLQDVIKSEDKSDVTKRKRSKKNKSSSDNRSKKTNEIEMKNLNMSEHSSTSSKTNDNQSINSKTENQPSLARILSGSLTSAYMVAAHEEKNNPTVPRENDDNDSINSKTEDQPSLARILSGSLTSAYMVAAHQEKNNPPVPRENDDDSINSKAEDQPSLARILSGSLTSAYMVAAYQEKNNPTVPRENDDDSINSKAEDQPSLARILSSSLTSAYMVAADQEKKNPTVPSKTDDNDSLNYETENQPSLARILSGSLTSAYMVAADQEKKKPTVPRENDDDSINSKAENQPSLARILSGSLTSAYMVAADQEKKNPTVPSKTSDNDSINYETEGQLSLTRILSGSLTSAYMVAADQEKKNPTVPSKTGDNDSINYETEGQPSIARILSSSLTSAYMVAADKDMKQSQLSQHGSLDLHELKLDVKTLKDDVAQTKQDVNKIRHQVKQLKADKGSLTETSPLITSNTSLPGSKELDTTDNNFIIGNNKRQSKSMGVIGDSKKNQNESVKNLESRIAALERKIKVTDDPKNINDSNCIEEIQRLVASINDIQNEIDKMKQSDAMNDNEKQKHDILVEQIELLKILKADKEDLEDALTDKADTDVVNRKVSYDRFQSTCNDITRNVEDAISKLTQQEKTWKLTLDNVQQEINNKLDRVELSPIEEFITNQLQAVHDKLEELEEERRKNEAAGTKKILNDVSCISCNKNVTMRMDQGPIYKNNLMSYNGNNNSKPYIAYSMHRMKKQLKQFPGKNINQFTAALQETRRKKTRRNNLVDKSSKDYFCNRYCGGSHTITTPQQRIMRTENYPVEWSPEILNPEILNTPRPNVCKPEKNVCCSAFNNQPVFTSINQHQSYEKFETAQQPQNHKEQKYRSSKISLGRQGSKKNQSKQILTESLNSKNILPTITDNKGALKVN